MSETNQFIDNLVNFGEKKILDMSTTELKNVLIQRISEIQDKTFLEAIRTILDAKAESKILYLTSEITREIMASKQEIDKGLYIENNMLEKEVEEWLHEK